MPTIPLAVPNLGGNEAAYVAECLANNAVSSVGPFVDRFEAAFAARVGSRHAVACVSGTAALHVALRLAGAASDKTVAVSSFTFIASANAVVYTGAEPVFVDSERTTWNLDTDRLHSHIVAAAKAGRPVPAAIEVVHTLGHPADLEPLLALRDRFGIRIVEDAAEALGARVSSGTLAGREVGSIGDFGCFSFNGNKIITSGGGGMIVTDDPELAQRAKHLTTQAKESGRGYVHDEVGYNYRLTNVAAAVGLAQLEQLDGFLDAKRAIAQRYNEGLADLPVTPPPHADWADPSFWLYSILLDDGAPAREAVLDSLEARGVGARPVWLPLHRQRPYRRHEVLLTGVADDLSQRGISLPSSTSLTLHEQATVVDALHIALSPA